MHAVKSHQNPKHPSPMRTYEKQVRRENHNMELTNHKTNHFPDVYDDEVPQPEHTHIHNPSASTYTDDARHRYTVQWARKHDKT